MAKPLDQFGGWLKFFYVMQWVSVVAWGIFTLLFVLSILGAENFHETIEFSIAFFDALITLILCIKIVRAIKRKDTYIPNRMIQLMTWLVIFTALFAVCEGLFYYATLGVEGLSNLAETGKGLFRVLIWYVIWTDYFKKSKRVLAYYGQNATKLNKIGLTKQSSGR